MKIVDLETAQNLLHRTSRGPSLLQPTGPPKEHQPSPQPPVPPASHHGPPGRGIGGGGGGGGGGDPGYNSPREQFHGPPPLQGRVDDRGRGGPPPHPPHADYNRMRVSPLWNKVFQRYLQ